MKTIGMFSKIKDFLNADTLISSKERKNHPYILAFLLPFIVLSIIYIRNGIYPFGKNSFLFGDFDAQYYPFMMYFRNALLSHEDLQFSWNMGIGANFYSVYCYYLSSPLNLLVVLAPEKYVLEFMEIMILLKICFASTSFAFYLSRHYNTNRNVLAVFGLLYSLSGYIAAYFYVVMWLDVFALAPVVILHLEKLIKEKKSLMYSGLLALAIVCNYYLAMHLCIFLILYYILQMLLLEYPVDWTFRKKCRAFLRTTGRFILYSLLSAGIASFILIPTMYFVRNTGYSSGYFPKDWNFYFSPFSAFARHMAEVRASFDTHEPNLYCGVIILVLLPIFFLNRKISLKKKIVFLLAILFMLLCFSLNVLNYICHGLNYPNCLPARQAFLYDFLILSMCFESIMIEKITSKKIVTGLICAFIFMAISFFTVNDSLITMKSYIMTAVFLVVECFILLMCLRKKGDQTFWLILGVIVIMGEVSLNMNHCGFCVASRDESIKNDQGYKEAIQLAQNDSEDAFFRMELSQMPVTNKGLYLGYHSTSMFSSSINASSQHFFNALGGSASASTYYWNKDGNPILNMLLNVEYIMALDETLESDYLTYLGTCKDVSLYRCEATLPFGYIIPSKTKSEIENLSGNPANIINSVAYSLGIENVLLIQDEEAPAGRGEGMQIVKEDGYYYVNTGNPNISDITIEVVTKDNDYTILEMNSAYGNMLHYLGFLEKDTAVRIRSVKENYTTAKIVMGLYRLNKDAILELAKVRNNFTFEMLTHTNTSLSAEVESDDGGILVMSMMNEEGWTAWIDDEPATMDTFCDALIAFNISPGKHTIKMKYQVKGLKAGCILSICSVLLYFSIFVSKKCKSYKSNDN